METNNYYEVQYFRKKWIFFLSLITCIPLLALMIYGLVSQVFYGIPFGSHPISDTGIWILSVIVAIVTTGIPLLIYITKMIIKVNDNGFCFRYFPFHLRYLKISLSDIDKFEIRQFSPLSDFGGWGLRKNLITKERAYIISGNKGISFTFKNGKKVVIGTQRPEELLEAIKKIK